MRAARDEGVLDSVVVTVPDAAHPVAALASARGFAAVPVTPPGAPLAASVAAGIAALEARVPPGPAALVVLLGDQPALRPAAIRAVADGWHATGAAAVRARYVDEPRAPGHPFLLARAHWPLAARARGDRGLAAVLHGAGIDPHVVDLPGRNPDIDTPADLAAWLGRE